MTEPFPGPPQGGSPYGGAPYSPYGSNPYGATRPAAPFDGLSIAALVCSLTCCAAPVAIGLGIAGIVRTGGGRRKGRWAAVTGLVLGVVGTLSLVGLLVFAGFLGFRLLEPYDAEVGQCINDSTTFDTLLKADCDGGHDGEVIAVEELDQKGLTTLRDSPSDFCTSRPLAKAYTQALASDDYIVDWSSSGYDRFEPEVGDWVVCWVERSDGHQLDAPIAELIGQRGA